eukprot:4274878-Pyramimonas_sp.AAC.1
MELLQYRIKRRIGHSVFRVASDRERIRFRSRTKYSIDNVIEYSPSLPRGFGFQVPGLVFENIELPDWVPSKFMQSAGLPEISGIDRPPR